MKNEKKYGFFVYGTLRNGLGNYRGILEGNTTKEISATAKGVMFPVQSDGFPCVIKGTNEIKGELMYIIEEKYQDVKMRLDWLEGYNEENKEDSMYIRELVTVTTEEGEEIEAYMYFWNRPYGYGEEIRSGDWKDYKLNKHAI